MEGVACVIMALTELTGLQKTIDQLWYDHWQAGA